MTIKDIELISKNADHRVWIRNLFQNLQIYIINVQISVIDINRTYGVTGCVNELVGERSEVA